MFPHTYKTEEPPKFNVNDSYQTRSGKYPTLSCYYPFNRTGFVCEVFLSIPDGEDTILRIKLEYTTDSLS
jgi:hypothetical protein